MNSSTDSGIDRRPTHLRRPDGTAAARAGYERALKLDPGNPAARQGLAETR